MNPSNFLPLISLYNILKKLDKDILWMLICA